MTWGDLSRLVSCRQTLRRGLGLLGNSMRTQDTVLMCVPPIRTKFVPDEMVAPRKSRPFHIRWPEDKLMHEYFRKNPDVRQIPYRLNSFEAPFPKRFALRQLEVMKMGRSKEEAYAIVAQEMKPEMDALTADAMGVKKKHAKMSVLAIVQEEEERQLRRAMQQLRKAA